jgi:hypothetical protein
MGDVSLICLSFRRTVWQPPKKPDSQTGSGRLAGSKLLLLWVETTVDLSFLDADTRCGVSWRRPRLNFLYAAAFSDGPTPRLAEKYLHRRSGFLCRRGSPVLAGVVAVATDYWGLEVNISCRVRGSTELGPVLRQQAAVSVLTAALQQE